MTNIPRGDPLKPQPGRREPGARSVRGPKLAEDLTVTAAAHTLDGHAGSLTKSRLNSTTLVEEGNGVPTHTAERSTQYQDLDTNKVYINADGATTWVEIGTGAAATTFLGLTDTPASYAGQTGKVVTVNGAETALEFIAAAGGGAVATDVIWDTKGDLAVATGADAAIKLAAAADNAVLQTLASEATGLIWRTAPRLANIADTAGTNQLTLAAASPHVLVPNDLRVSGVVGIQSVPSATNILTITPTATVGANRRGIYLFPDWTTTHNFANVQAVTGSLRHHPASGMIYITTYGLSFGCEVYGDAVASGATTHNLLLQGTGAGAYVYHLVAAGTRTLNFDEIVGHASGIVLQYTGAGSAGTVTDAILYKGNWVFSTTGGSLAVTNAKGLYLDNPASAVVVNYYGIQIEDESTATGLIYPIYQVGPNGKNYFGSPMVYNPTAAQNITAVGNTILANGRIVQLTANASYTLTSTPTIADGTSGQVVTIVNVDTTDVITIQDQGTLGSSNLRLTTTTFAIGPRDSITLMYNATVGDWVEIYRSNVI